jgi:hypothetical protein
MSEKLEPLPKSITDEIRFILEGCRDGRLKHKQDNYHCGTKHCVAGWKEIMDFVSETNGNNLNVTARSKRFNDWQRRAYESLNLADADTWNYAERAWGLTDNESFLLFDMDATLDDQFSLLERLEAGERDQ